MTHNTAEKQEKTLGYTTEKENNNDPQIQFNGFSNSSYINFEGECISHMATNGFFNVPLPIDISGKTIKFSGRDGVKERTEWYKGSQKENGSLIVTYNSFHDSLKNEHNYVFNSSSIDHVNEIEAKAQKENNIKMQKIRIDAEEKKRKDRAEHDRIRFNNASETGSSKYLERKQVKPHGIRFEKTGTETIILIPMCDENGEIQALQEIFETKREFVGSSKPRDKNFTNSVKGLFHVIGNIIDGNEIRVSEGYATSATCYESTGGGVPHVVAFSAGAYKTIIPILRKLYLNSPILICADNNQRDIPDEENTGIAEAEKAAKGTAGCSLVYPVFLEGKDRNVEGKRYADFNDLVIVSGKDEVKRQIESAPPKNQNKPDQNEADECEDEIGDDNAELKKATASARRRALINKATYDEIVKDIRKHPTIREKAYEIAGKALLWAKKYQTDCEVIVNGIPKKITDMKSLDSRYAQLEAPGNPCIIILRQDAQPISDKDFSKRLSGEVVLAGVDTKGLPKYLDASKFWSGNINKRIYTKIAFTSQPVTEDTYNLFTGFGIKPKKGKCERILNHIEEVICAGNIANKAALINLLAWQIQNIGKPSRVITVLKSKDQQIGKGTLLQDILKETYGNAGLQTHELDQILGRFNDSLRGKSFIYLDEALFAGNRKAADAIKSLSTATNTGIETKNVPIIQLPIGINFFLTTNHDDAAYIEETDARYWILEVSPHRQDDFEYFNELYEEINNGGREAFMDYLLNLDVSGFLPARDVPKDNAAKDAMIKNSINPYDARKWLEACCHAGMILGLKPQDKHSTLPWELWRTGEEYVNGIFSTSYTEWQKTVKSPVAPKPTPDNKFGELLNKAGFTKRIQDGTAFRKLPHVEECLKTVTDMIEKSSKK